MNIHFDMETADPDDVITLCWLANHPVIILRSVSVTPGTLEQIGLVKHILKLSGKENIPVGSFNPNHDKKCVSPFYYKWFNSWSDEQPEDEGYKVIENTIKNFPDITIVTGAPLKNFSKLDPEIKIRRWVAQGGFAGDNIVPEEYRLEKFKGKVTCPTFNFNGDIPSALKMLNEQCIAERILVSKNVCHSVVYDKDIHQEMSHHKDKNLGLKIIYEGMTKYLEKHPKGKALHDPLAACVALNPGICEFRKVKMYYSKGEWGAKEDMESDTSITIYVDKIALFNAFILKDFK